jgi:predicted ATPase/class 3 adenylate cyclase
MKLLHDDQSTDQDQVPGPAGADPVAFDVRPPTGTITFLFTDIEGSTRFWEYYPDAMQRTLARHDAVLRHVITTHGGYIFTTAGDAFSVAFHSPMAAIEAAIEAQRRLAAEKPDEMGRLRVRMALHTGAADERDGDYFGPTLNRCARLLAAGHGGQVLVSLTTGELVRDLLGEKTDLRDLGEHRLRDLARPERVFQLLHSDLPASFPSIRSLDAYAHNLPVQVTSFIGRKRDLEAVAELMPHTRLLTLTGVGGSGKTRLALQAAAELISVFRDGVWLVELGSLRDGGLISIEVAAALGVEQLRGSDMQDSLIEYLRNRHILLILDNCEHLIDATVGLLGALLRSCPQLQVMVTSREALGMAGEVLYLVPSLSVPPESGDMDLAVLDEHESVRLFVDRAAAVRPGFSLTAANSRAVADISRRLDGIPLAIELAASRIRAMSAEQLADRLDDRFALLTGGSRSALPRQQTLEAAMDWSYELLTDPEQHLLQRLSVFRGGFSMEAAEHVGAAGAAGRFDALDLLSRLVDKSLVVAEERGDEMRYRLFETVRTYARAKLEAGEDLHLTAARHAEYHLALAEKAETWMRGPRETTWLRRLETEHDNLRASIEWALEQGQGEMALRFSWALLTYWVSRGFAQEGLRLVDRSLHLADGVDPLVRARGMEAASMLYVIDGDIARAARMLGESEDTFAALNADHDQGLALLRMAAIATAQGDHDRAGDLYARALLILEEAGDRWGVASCLEGQGDLALNNGDLEAARAVFAQSLELRRRFNHPRSVAQSLVALGSIELAEAEYEQAGELLEEALALFKGVGSKHQMISATMQLGQVESVQGDLDWAYSLLAEATRLAIESGGGSPAPSLLGSWALLARRRDRLERAVRLWAAEATHLESLGVQREMFLGRLYEAEIDAIRNALPVEAYEEAWAAGASLGWLEAIEQD